MKLYDGGDPMSEMNIMRRYRFLKDGFGDRKCAIPIPEDWVKSDPALQRLHREGLIDIAGKPPSTGGE